MSGEKHNSKGMKIAIIVLTILLLLSLGALAARVIYLAAVHGDSATAVVPDNLIGGQGTSSTATGGSEPAGTVSIPSTGESAVPSIPSVGGTTVPFVPSIPATGETALPSIPSLPGSEPAQSTAPSSIQQQTAATLALHKHQLTDNQKFTVSNMLPGDTYVQYYCLKASHDGQIEVFFSATVTRQTKHLADVLQIKVTQLDTGLVLYEGAMSGLSADGYGQKFAASETQETVVFYQIEVSLPTWVGNEYQQALLEADFRWYVTDDSHMSPPQTGDGADMRLWKGMLIGSAVMLTILLVFRRRKEEDAHAQ